MTHFPERTTAIRPIANTGPIPISIVGKNPLLMSLLGRYGSKKRVALGPSGAMTLASLTRPPVSIPF